jgi:hypothetical protein
MSVPPAPRRTWPRTDCFPRHQAGLGLRRDAPGREIPAILRALRDLAQVPAPPARRYTPEDIQRGRAARRERYAAIRRDAGNGMSGHRARAPRRPPHHHQGARLSRSFRAEGDPPRARRPGRPARPHRRNARSGPADHRGPHMAPEQVNRKTSTAEDAAARGGTGMPRGQDQLRQADAAQPLPSRRPPRCESGRLTQNCPGTRAAGTAGCLMTELSVRECRTLAGRAGRVAVSRRLALTRPVASSTADTSSKHTLLSRWSSSGPTPSCRALDSRMPQQVSELSHHMRPVGVCQGAFREMLTSIIVAPSARVPVHRRTNRRRAPVELPTAAGAG